MVRYRYKDHDFNDLKLIPVTCFKCGVLHIYGGIDPITGKCKTFCMVCGNITNGD